MKPMDRVLHANRGALVLEVQGHRARIHSEGKLPRWVPLASLTPATTNPPERVEEIVAEKESWNRTTRRKREELESALRNLRTVTE